MTIMERRKEGSKENRGSCEGDRFYCQGGEEGLFQCVDGRKMESVTEG